MCSRATGGVSDAFVGEAARETQSVLSAQALEGGARASATSRLCLCKNALHGCGYRRLQTRSEQRRAHSLPRHRHCSSLQERVKPDPAVHMPMSLIDITGGWNEQWGAAGVLGTQRTQSVSQWKSTANGRRSRKVLRRFCKSHYRQQWMRACWGAWLAFSRKKKQLQIQQHLQRLRTVKALATTCLFHWASVFVAVGARRTFLSLKGLEAFTAFVSRSRQELEAGRSSPAAMPRHRGNQKPLC